MQTCKTTKVVADNEQGFVVINDTDFNEEVHELFVKNSGKTVLTIPQIKSSLDAMGVPYPPNANKADLMVILNGLDS